MDPFHPWSMAIRASQPSVPYRSNPGFIPTTQAAIYPAQAMAAVPQTPKFTAPTRTQPSTPHTMMSQASEEACSKPSYALPVISAAEDLKPLLRERIPKNMQGSVYKSYIKGVADFHQQSTWYQSLSSKPPGYAGDFPRNDAEIEVLAKGLTDAMTNMADAVEVGKKSVARIHQLSPYEVVLKSWKLLFILRDVQLGQVDLHLWGAEWDIEVFDCFMDRYESVKSKLTISKSLVSSLFDQEFGIRLALSPGSELKKKMANSRNNSRRAIELASIRDQKKRKSDAGDEEDEDDEFAPENGGGRPPKRIRRPELPTQNTTHMLAPANHTDSPQHTPVEGERGYDLLQLEDFVVPLNLDSDYA